MAALIVGAPPKWMDNLLSHYELVGVARARQGVERRITDDGLVAIEITRLLYHELAVPLARAAALANAAVRGGDVRVRTAGGLVLEFPADIRQRLAARAVEAAESVATVRRGRPPRSARPQNESAGP